MVVTFFFQTCEESSLQKDTIITEQKMKLSKFEALSRDSQSLNSEDSAMTMYRAAQETIASLQQSVQKKDETLTKFLLYWCKCFIILTGSKNPYLRCVKTILLKNRCIFLYIEVLRYRR